MANDYFNFKQFTIHQQRCAMKVGTDGTLLGAWAQVPFERCRILDIGTGTGLIALMMAQRFPESSVVGVDIDADAVVQATENVMKSPFSKRVSISLADVKQLTDTDGFDAIVCNPPYFIDSLTCPNEQRTTARHAITLSFETLLQSASRLLNKDGLFSLILPSESFSIFESTARHEGFFPSRICRVKTTPKKSPMRQLIEYQKQPVNELYISEEVVEISHNVRSPWYQSLTQAFYIK